MAHKPTAAVKRKHISWKTKYASALLALGHIPYNDAKLMTEDQIISLYHVDHNMLHETGHPDRDAFWNLTPTLIKAHRIKTKTDRKVIDKGRRIRKNLVAFVEVATNTKLQPWQKTVVRKLHKLRSRGFDRTRRRKMDGTVVKR